MCARRVVSHTHTRKEHTQQACIRARCRRTALCRGCNLSTVSPTGSRAVQTQSAAAINHLASSRGLFVVNHVSSASAAPPAAGGGDNDEVVDGVVLVHYSRADGTRFLPRRSLRQLELNEGMTLEKLCVCLLALSRASPEPYSIVLVQSSSGSLVPAAAAGARKGMWSARHRRV